MPNSSGLRRSAGTTTMGSRDLRRPIVQAPHKRALAILLRLLGEPSTVGTCGAHLRENSERQNQGGDGNSAGCEKSR